MTGDEMRFSHRDWVERIVDHIADLRFTVSDEEFKRIVGAILRGMLRSR